MEGAGGLFLPPTDDCQGPHPLRIEGGRGTGEDEGGVGVTRPGVWSLLILPPPRRTPRIKGGELQAAGYGSALVGKGRVS